MDQRATVLELREQHRAAGLAGHAVNEDVRPHATKHAPHGRSALWPGGDDDVADHVIDHVDEFGVASRHPAGGLASPVQSGDPPGERGADGVARQPGARDSAIEHCLTNPDETDRRHRENIDRVVPGAGTQRGDGGGDAFPGVEQLGPESRVGPARAHSGAGLDVAVSRARSLGQFEEVTFDDATRRSQHAGDP